ncbi:MAG: DNA primase [Brumimicrobium sp.]
MSRIPEHIVDEVMNTARIEEVIREYVHLKKAGSNYKGLSPFVDEKTPSFMVSPAKQIFKDFSSGKGGTVVTFLMEIEQFSFPEAVKWLANRYNITLPEEKPLTPEEVLELSERESLQIVNDFAKDYFVDTIKNTKEGKTVGYSYFIERGFTPEIIEKFQLGYCPRDEKSLTETAIAKGFKQEYLETLGLTKVKDGRSFDFFSGRVIFPIHSVSGKVLGFGARTLSTRKDIAKYFNSPESILYDKSRVLYGVHFAKQEIVKQDNCYLVEGYADVISLSQSGIENVVSSSGTALTKGQVKLIKRYTNNITILYDSDAAGIKASFRGIDLLLEEGMKVKVLLFPEGEDPDSYAKKVSSDVLKKYIHENQQDFVEFKTGILLQGTKNDPIKRSELIKEIVNSIALIPDNITRSVYIKEVSTQFDMEEQLLLNELNKLRRKRHADLQRLTRPQEMVDFTLPSEKDIPSQKGLVRSYYEQERDLLRILLLYGDREIELNPHFNEKIEEKGELVTISVSELIVGEIERDGLSFDNQLFQDIYEVYRDSLKEGEFYDLSKYLRNENQEIVQLVTDILTVKYELSPEWLNRFKIEITEEKHRLSFAVKEVIYAFKNSVVMQRIDALLDRLKNEPNLAIEEQVELQRQIMKLEKVKRGFAEALNRKVL